MAAKLYNFRIAVLAITILILFAGSLMFAEKNDAIVKKAGKYTMISSGFIGVLLWLAVLAIEKRNEQKQINF